MFARAVRPSSLLQVEAPWESEPAWIRYGPYFEETTAGRFILVSPQQLQDMRRAGREREWHPLRDEDDVARCRHLVRQVTRDDGLLSEERTREAELCAGEACANAVLHAGAGTMELVLGPGAVQIWVTDHGAGIPPSELPQAALLRGYSTRDASLGAGFNVMRELADRVYLYSESGGTTVVLEFVLDGPLAEFGSDNEVY